MSSASMEGMIGRESWNGRYSFKRRGKLLATVDNTLPIDPFVAWRMTNEAK